MHFTLCFGDFIIISNKRYDSIGRKIDYYGIQLGDKRDRFDPKHFINDAKMTQNIKEYEDDFFVDDVLRNCDET